MPPLPSADPLYPPPDWNTTTLTVTTHLSSPCALAFAQCPSLPPSCPILPPLDWGFQTASMRFPLVSPGDPYGSVPVS